MNGWFVNLDGLVFAVINGSMYQVDPEPFMQDLEPGFYDEDFNPVAMSLPNLEEGNGKETEEE